MKSIDVYLFRVMQAVEGYCQKLLNNTGKSPLDSLKKDLSNTPSEESLKALESLFLTYIDGACKVRDTRKELLQHFVTTFFSFERALLTAPDWTEAKWKSFCGEVLDFYINCHTLNSGHNVTVTLCLPGSEPKKITLQPPCNRSGLGLSDLQRVLNDLILKGDWESGIVQALESYQSRLLAFENERILQNLSSRLGAAEEGIYALAQPASSDDGEQYTELKREIVDLHQQIDDLKKQLGKTSMMASARFFPKARDKSSPHASVNEGTLGANSTSTMDQRT